jgi:ubiquinone/menaquinone biosynthesis C-methylase UbiE
VSFSTVSPRAIHDFSRCKRTPARPCLFQHRLVRSAELLCGSHGTLLDCASGTGEITRAVIANSQFERAVINDFSPRMIERCREAFGEAMPAGSVTWTIHNVFDLGGISRSGAFDVILCLGLIAHCGQFPRLMQEMSSLLKPGGTMLIQSSLLDHFSGRVVKYVAQSKLKRTNYVVASTSRIFSMRPSPPGSRLSPLIVSAFACPSPTGYLAQ